MHPFGYPGSVVLLWIVLAMSFLSCATGFVRQFRGRLASPIVSRQQNRLFGKHTEAKVNKYSHTVFLPTTTFDQRANAAVKEKEIQKWWDSEHIYDKMRTSSQGPNFVLHDGPPYANGDLHIGHALNKILKDFVCKYQTLQGKRVSYVPGWDCHGLPIEHKVLQEMPANQRKSLDPVTLRKRAGEFAKQTVQSQMAGFKRFGVWGDWDKPYLTMDPSYEAAQIRAFGKMVQKGYIYRGLKPVHWSPSSQSALAEAELEYPETHVSTAAYIGFTVSKPSEKLQQLTRGKQTKLAIWTTTPWTIPANMAVAVNGEVEYSLIKFPDISTYCIVATDLVGSLKTLLNIEQDIEICGVIKGSDLTGTIYEHPLQKRECPVVIGGDYINTQSGTGLVHTAPGHGHDDYNTCLKYNIHPFSPVDERGKFTAEAGPELIGLDVLADGNKAVIDKLTQSNNVLHVHRYPHKYPYDWRTKKPTIVRATEQWFANLSLFRDQALDAINSVTWVPSAGKNRITAMVDSRAEWCISRQRSWGVPIPVFYHKDTGDALMNEQTLGHVADLFEKHGSDCWWTFGVEELLPAGQLRDSASNYSKGTDTMDVWFDSGTSWAGVLNTRDNLTYPADVYLEGSDQHRGWFQSSLLTSVAVNGISPYKSVITHGFTLDEKGMKMSKSVGNVIDPMAVIEGGKDKKKQPAYGADTLRLWVSSVDYSGDACIGDNIMKTISDSYRKIRNTFRFMLGSLADFSPDTDSVPRNRLPSIDKYILGRLSEVRQEVQAAYDSYHYFRVYQVLLQFCTTDLSAFYLDIVKDRLYISRKNDLRRRAAQTVIHHCMEQVAVMMTPITPHMAEELWQNVPYPKSENEQSIFQKLWPTTNFPSHEVDKWNRLKKLRNDVNKALEKARTEKVIGGSQESKVYIYCGDESFRQVLSELKGHDDLADSTDYNNLSDDLRFFLLCSQVEFVDSLEKLQQATQYTVLAAESESDIGVGVSPAKGNRCERCWYYAESVGKHHEHSDLCSRCCSVLE
jgi:isoleucyl-tRNA synthetase